jgi:RNA polymerase subunit RPABC4/transcription elongation factor Spt4
MTKYYLLIDGEKKGPYALSQLRKMWDSGAITMDTKYVSEEMTSWADIGALMEDGDVSDSSQKKAAEEIAAEEIASEKIKKNISKLAHVELRDCPACGEPISRDAATCPACGCNFYQRWIRIFVTIILPSIAGVLLLGWGVMALVKSGVFKSLLSAFLWLALFGGIIAGLIYGIQKARKRWNINIKMRGVWSACLVGSLIPLIVVFTLVVAKSTFPWLEVCLGITAVSIVGAVVLWSVGKSDDS